MNVQSHHLTAATDNLSTSTLVAVEPGLTDGLGVAGAFEDQVFLCLVLLAVGCLTLLGVAIGALMLRSNTIRIAPEATSAII